MNIRSKNIFSSVFMLTLHWMRAMVELGLL